MAKRRFRHLQMPRQIPLIVIAVLVSTSAPSWAQGPAATSSGLPLSQNPKATAPVAGSAKSTATTPIQPAAQKAAPVLPANPEAASPTMPPSTSQSLGWDDAIRLTRDENAELRASDEVVKQNEALVKAAWGNYLPSLNASLSTTKANTNETAVADSNSARLNLTQNLLNGFGDRARIEQSKRNRDAAQATRDLTRAQVSASLKTAYQSLLVAERNVKLSDDIIARRKRNLDLVTLRFEGGRENKGSVLLSRANYEQAVLERLQAANTIEASRAQLAKMIGVERFPYLTLSGVVPVSTPPLAVDFEAAAAQSPELRQALAQQQAADAAVSVAKQGYFPTLDLTASIGRFGPDFLPQQTNASATLGLVIPLFNGGRVYYGVQAARAVAYNASYARETALRSKIVSIRQAYNAYIEAVTAEKVAQSFVTAAETRAEIGRSKYNTGLLSFEEWDIIESDLVTRQRRALTSQNDRVSAEAAWEQSQGLGVFN